MERARLVFNHSTATPLTMPRARRSLTRLRPVGTLDSDAQTCMPLPRNVLSDTLNENSGSAKLLELLQLPM